MIITNKLKTFSKIGATLVAMNFAIVNHAQAEFTRACPASLKVVATTQVGTNRTIFTLKNRSIVPEITM